MLPSQIHFSHFLLYVHLLPLRNHERLRSLLFPFVAGTIRTHYEGFRGDKRCEAFQRLIIALSYLNLGRICVICDGFIFGCREILHCVA